MGGQSECTLRKEKRFSSKNINIPKNFKYRKIHIYSISFNAALLILVNAIGVYLY